MAAAEEIGQDGCCVPESEMMVTLDENLEVPWKGGNKFSRICPECNSRTFCAGSLWEAANDDPSRVAYIIEKDETSPRPVYVCPYGDDWVERLPEDYDEEPCGEEFLGTPLGEAPPDECPHCEREISFGDEEKIEE